MSNATTLMNIAAETSREALVAFEEGLDKLNEDLKAAQTKAETLVEAAQEVCGHEYVTTLHWTEDGAFPNEPHSRTDCTICKKENVAW